VVLLCLNFYNEAIRHRVDRKDVNYRLAVGVNTLDSQVGKNPIGFSGICIKERFEVREADLQSQSEGGFCEWLKR